MTDTPGACPPPDARWPVGFIGVGNMGGALLQRLCALGWPVQAHDLDAERCAAAAAAGATLQPSPAAVAAHCRSLLVVVVDAAQCEAVLFGEQGAAATLAPGSVVLCCPTLGPQDVADAAARLARQGVSLIDAPMSGGPQRARDGQMSLMLAGAAAVLEAQQPLLAALAGARFVISERPGDAARTKLVNNLLAAVNLAGAAEALALAQALGLQGRRTLAVIAASSGQSWIGQDRLQRALDGDFAPRAHTRLLAKDSRLALAAARDAGLPAPPLGQLAQQTFAQACSRGLAEFDDASLLLLGGGRAEPAQATPPAVPEELTAALAEEAEVLASCAALARRLGLGEVIPRIIGRHSNLAVHLSPLPLVARVATGTARWRGNPARAGRELALARHLADHGAAVLAPAPGPLAGPHVAGRWVMSLWQQAVVLSGPPDPHEAGRRLARCHAVLQDGQAPTGDALPDASAGADGPLDELLRLLADPLVVAPAAPQDLHRVRDQALACQAAWAAAPEAQWLHGDAHLNNVLTTPGGPLWGDWEDAVRGPTAYDLACLVAASRVLGTDQAWSEAALQGWCDASGRPPDAALLALCIRVRTLFVVGWMWALGAARGDARRQARLAGRLAWLARTSP